MKTVTISFCGGHIEQVLDHNDKHAILENIRLCINLTADQKYYKILRESADTSLLGFPHVMTPQSTGHKHWLFLTQVHHENYCVLIERRVRNGYPYPKMMLPLFDFDDALFSNTLFEVEVAALTDEKRYVMLIGDLLMFKNRNAREWDPLRRFSTIHSVMKNNYRENIVNQPCALQVKRLFTKAQWRNLLQFQKKLPYTSNGLVFFPMNSRFHTRVWIDGRDELKKVPDAPAAGGRHPKKKKESDDGAAAAAAATVPAPALPPPPPPPPPPPATVSEDDDRACLTVKEWLRWQPDAVVDALRWCFQLEQTKQAEIYNAYMQVEGKLRYYDIMHVPSLEQSRELQSHFDAMAESSAASSNVEPFRVRAECAYNRKFHKWYPVTVACDTPVKNVTRRALFSGGPG